jgi:GT2 family glycosyltransferase
LQAGQKHKNMPSKIAIIISPNWRDYGKKYLPDCIASVRAQDCTGEKKIFITDNESTDESYSFLKTEIPEAEIFRSAKNSGFAEGNNIPMRSALEQGFDYLFLANIDTVLEPDCLSKAVRAAESDPSIGAVQPRIMLWPEKEKINSLGCATHFLGFGFCEKYRENWLPEETGASRVQNIFYPSGAGVLFKKSALESAGLFDKEFIAYNEDQDLGWRIWLAGYRCVIAFDSVMYHKYEFAKSIKHYYWMDRNRMIAMLKNYHWATLMMIAPAFVIMELGLILFSIKTGWFLEKLKVWKYFFNYNKLKYIFNERKKIQNQRKIADKQIIKLISGKIWYQEIDDPKLRLINPFFNFYWLAVKKIIWW